jgi:hypothetical protein
VSNFVQLTLFRETVGVEDALCQQCGAYYVSKACVDPDASWAEAIARLGPGSWDQDQWSLIRERHPLIGEAALEFLARQGFWPPGPGLTSGRNGASEAASQGDLLPGW